MSFDLLNTNQIAIQQACLNPFRAGRCLSTDDECRSNEHFDVSIPFEQGDVFRQEQYQLVLLLLLSLNPFRAGRCLSTKIIRRIKTTLGLNPFRAGRCLSTLSEETINNVVNRSQSLSSRAMSFDKVLRNNSINLSYVSIPFEQGDVFRHSFCCYWCSCFCVSIPFEQGDVFRR